MDSANTMHDRIVAAIEPTVADLGYDLVLVRLSGESGEGRVHLQVMAEPADGSGMTVDDCAAVSRAVSAVLDVEDPIEGAYTLEVSSPGVERPLTREGDFERYAGHKAKVELGVPMEDGRKRFRGTVLGCEEGRVILRLDDDSEVALPFRDVARAKLMMEDSPLARGKGKKH